jgi:serine/threonine protein kinase/peptidoglycan hydrolase-like protein with peptidoglycan-binding domain
MTGEVADTDAASASEVDFVALQADQTIGRYTVVSVLGQGGFGITYRAHDNQLDREVAIKEYLPTAIAVRQGGTTVLPRSTKVADDFTWGRERFVSEGRTMASLHYAPGIVRVFDFLEINGTAYIVMELLHGETLADRIKEQGPLDAAAIGRILTPLLDGLEEVHKAGFLHRDIKPANILLNAKGDPTLIDFGASRAAMAGRSVAMTAVFTPGYAAAEQMTSAKQGPWTDIYGVSATLYHAITGVAPPSAFDRMLGDTYEPLAKRALAGFGAGLLAGIDAGLAVRATDRPQSIAGWRQVLLLTAMPDDASTVAAIGGNHDAAATIMVTVPRPTAVPRQATVQAPPPPTSPSPPEISATAAAPVDPAVQPALDDRAAAPAAAPKSRLVPYASAAVGLVALAGVAGYFLLGSQPTREASVAGQAVTIEDLKIEDLERVLAERRAADAAAAEKKRLEEEAQKKAELDSAAKVAADADLEKALQQRQQAEAELAKLKAEIEARHKEEQTLARRAEAEAAQRKAQAEMTALLQAEADARKKAAAEAEAKRQADEALTKAQLARQQADLEAKQKADAEAKQKAEATAREFAAAKAREKAEAEAKAKADAEAEAKAKADAEAEAKAKAAAAARAKVEAEAKAQAEAEAKQKAAADATAVDKKAAEAAEGALRLAMLDRQHVQVALTALGFDTHGSDGVFGPQSRAMIASWQKARNQPVTGFLSGPQNQALLKEAAPAIGKFDDDQKKVTEAKSKAEEVAKARALAPTAPASPPSTAPVVASVAPQGVAPGTGGGSWTGSATCTTWPSNMPLRVTMSGGKGSLQQTERSGKGKVEINIDNGQISGGISWIGDGLPWTATFAGRATGGRYSQTVRLVPDMGTTKRFKACKIELALTPG